MNMDKMCMVVEEELKKIAEKGLNTSNLETAYKLIDMYKDLKNTEYWEFKMEEGGYSQDGYSMNEGYSERGRDSRGRYSQDGGEGSGNSYASGRRGGRGGRGGRNRGEHYVRAHYSRGDGYSDASYGSGNSYGGDSYAYDAYMDSKQSYRAGKNPECKKKLMGALEEYMEDFSEQMEELLRDADCQEERETIERYLKKIKSVV